VTWTKLGDEFPAEARNLTDAEFRTHVEALCWSSLRLLDLRIPKPDVRRFAESPDAPDAVVGLVAKGWWTDAGETWHIDVKFPQWQQERSQIEGRRAYLAEAQRRSRAHRAGDHSLCLAGKCPNATSTVDSAVDATVDSTLDPGRDGSGPTDPPDPLKDKDRKPKSVGDLIADQAAAPHQEQPIANSQKRRVHDGRGVVADDAQTIPMPVQVQIPATDRNAREAYPESA
jgi:hypothetical protein